LKKIPFGRFSGRAMGAIRSGAKPGRQKPQPFFHAGQGGCLKKLRMADLEFQKAVKDERARKIPRPRPPAQGKQDFFLFFRVFIIEPQLWPVLVDQPPFLARSGLAEVSSFRRLSPQMQLSGFQGRQYQAPFTRKKAGLDSRSFFQLLSPKALQKICRLAS